MGRSTIKRNGRTVNSPSHPSRPTTDYPPECTRWNSVPLGQDPPKTPPPAPAPSPEGAEEETVDEVPDEKSNG